jgi:hypothetical protein
MPITDQQYQRLMNVYDENGGVIGHAAMKGAMHRETARRYLRAGQGPKELTKPHTWRTREDPVKAIWPEAQCRLEEQPALEAQTLFEDLLEKRPGAVSPRALRTFRRRVARWRKQHGPPLEVFFPQEREAARSIQLDWTNANELEVTIAGVPYPHLLCHSILPYSNAEWAIPCQSESTLSLKAGVQDACWEFGGVADELQTDQSSTATHRLHAAKSERVFNEEYLALCDHLKIQPRTIAIACPDQNGDIEAMHYHLKRRLKQKMLLRGSRDFESEEAYAAFVAGLCRELNRKRGAKVVEEIKLLRPLPAGRFPDTLQLTVPVSTFSTVRVKKCAYSVPARLIGTEVQAYVSEKAVVIRHLGEEVARHARVAGKRHQINYRHVIKSLVRKPGAFARCQYQEDLFPQPVFRQAYERLKHHNEPHADRDYVTLLDLAYDRGEESVADALGALLREGLTPLPDAVKTRLAEPLPPPPTALAPFTPNLGVYDALITEVAS